MGSGACALGQCQGIRFSDADFLKMLINLIGDDAQKCFDRFSVCAADVLRSYGLFALGLRKLMSVR